VKKCSFVTILCFFVVLMSNVWPGYVFAKYPERAVTVLCPHPAGGDTDMVARAITEAARKDFPKGIAVVNRVGGGGTIGITELVRSKPNGYTLSSTATAPILIAPQLIEVPFNKPDDYQAILRTFTTSHCLAVAKNAPWKNLQEFLAFARANPGKIRIGNAGEGTLPHLKTFQFAHIAKINLTIIPFTGGNESTKNLLGGHTEANVQAISEIISHFQAGTARVLVNFAENRNPLLPDVPTAKEEGLDMVVTASHYIIGPKGLPPEIISALHSIFKQAINDPICRTPLEKRGYFVNYQSGEDLKKHLLEEHAIYGDLLQQVGLAKKK
jgi:tripartite-type tricarboxylate transporter receptor subunit TctC